MPLLPRWISRYRALPRPVLLLAGGQFLINLINTSQFLLLNLFLKRHGMDDPAIAAMSSQRFVAMFFLAIPAGLWLRGTRLKWPMVLGSTLFPLTAIAAQEAVRCGWNGTASWCFLLMGFASLILNVSGMPMVLRLAPATKISEAFSLLFATWAAASICGGAFASVLQKIGALHWGAVSVRLDEHAVLLLMALAGLGAPLFYARLPDPPPVGSLAHDRLSIRRADVPLLLRTLAPTLCIATGAGLSIQFLNLFFDGVFKMSSDSYSVCGTVSNVLVLIAGLLVPEVKQRFGWRGSIIGVQGTAVVLLAAMGLTELWSAAPWALPLAVGCFILRQPLMSMAGPAVGELTMTYVGDRNRELMSACNGAIWSGSWWLAARVFQVMRHANQPYWVVFLTTAILYLGGTLLYLGIIRAVERGKTREFAP